MKSRFKLKYLDSIFYKYCYIFNNFRSGDVC